MPKRSLRPHLNQIRAWVRQGRTDAWIAHQLEVSVRDIEQFKNQNELEEDAGGDANGYPEEIDLRAEDDALIAAELEAAEAEAERERLAAAERDDEAEDEDAEDDGEGEEIDSARRARRRGRRGGRGRRTVRTTTLEGTFDHG